MSNRRGTLNLDTLSNHRGCKTIGQTRQNRKSYRQTKRSSLTGSNRPLSGQSCSWSAFSIADGRDLCRGHA